VPHQRPSAPNQNCTNGDDNRNCKQRRTKTSSFSAYRLAIAVNIITNISGMIRLMMEIILTSLLRQWLVDDLMEMKR
jgi:hypothetical protein